MSEPSIEQGTMEDADVRPEGPHVVATTTDDNGGRKDVPEVEREDRPPREREDVRQDDGKDDLIPDRDDPEPYDETDTR